MRNAAALARNNKCSGLLLILFLTLALSGCSTSSSYAGQSDTYRERSGYDRSAAQQTYETAEDAVTYFKSGGAYYDKGAYDLAIRDYDKAIALNPEDAKAYMNRYEAYYKKGEYDMAIRSYDKIIELNSGFSHFLIGRSVWIRGEGEYDLAKQHFDRAIELGGPRFAYVTRGDIHSGEGEYDLAIRDYDKAIELDPEDGEIYAHRALVYLAWEKWTSALNDLETAADKEYAFHFQTHYDSVEEFEEEYNVDVPENIRKLLEP